MSSAHIQLDLGDDEVEKEERRLPLVTPRSGRRRRRRTDGKTWRRLCKRHGQLSVFKVLLSSNFSPHNAGHQYTAKVIIMQGISRYLACGRR
ncbi:hypothetical protein ElyMa_003598000 [Elysia marginata]|uniref:Uncharacterized protein n=1 Tax=Elysia marginata TaxID=1093978 RepID=A0AAV4EQG6_9GAST|nr:hypothetical protein ElyMa_003598000 [Elysia marginata]